MLFVFKCAHSETMLSIFKIQEINMPNFWPGLYKNIPEHAELPYIIVFIDYITKFSCQSVWVEKCIVVMILEAIKGHESYWYPFNPQNVNPNRQRQHPGLQIANRSVFINEFTKMDIPIIICINEW